MVADQLGYFRTFIWMLGIPLDEERLTAVLRDSSKSPTSRFNVGIVGRSAEILDESERLHLERVVLAHPEADQLEVLLWELPWEPLELERRSTFDGRVVKGSDGESYFVSSGIRRRVRASWLESRVGTGLRDPLEIDDSELAKIPCGTGLR